ncbi:hypothetical protein EQK42_32380, partial [Streptomyces albidoflavus]
MWPDQARPAHAPSSARHTSRVILLLAHPSPPPVGRGPVQLRRSRTAAALAVAVIAGTLGGAPTALAA